MTHDAVLLGPTRHELRVDEYTAPRTPADGPPDTTRVLVIWHDEHGTTITDPDRIAELETHLAQKGT